MPKFIDPERYIEEAMVRGLRALFATDPDFTFDVATPANSLVQITSEKPKDSNWEIPNLYITGISYGISDAGLNRGFERDIIDAEGRESTTKVFDVPFSMNIVVSSKYSSTAKTLVNRLVTWVWILGRDFIEDELKIKVNRVRKGSGRKTELSENDEVFTEAISLEGSTRIRTKIDELDLSGILRRIELSEQLNEEGSVVQYDL